MKYGRDVSNTRCEMNLHIKAKIIQLLRLQLHKYNVSNHKLYKLYQWDPDGTTIVKSPFL